MKISTKGRYALRMMLDIAQRQGEGYVALKEIAQRQDISGKYMEQIISVFSLMRRFVPSSVSNSNGAEKRCT